MIRACQSYRESEILAADPVELIEILYRNALQSVEEARAHLRRGDIRRRSEAITKTSEILNELALSVDLASGGELARNLVELYGYMQSRLADANIHQTEPPLEEVWRLISTLWEGWRACRTSMPPVAPGAYTPLSRTC